LPVHDQASNVCAERYWSAVVAAAATAANAATIGSISGSYSVSASGSQTQVVSLGPTGGSLPYTVADALDPWSGNMAHADATGNVDGDGVALSVNASESGPGMGSAGASVSMNFTVSHYSQWSLSYDLIPEHGYHGLYGDGVQASMTIEDAMGNMVFSLLNAPPDVMDHFISSGTVILDTGKVYSLFGEIGTGERGEAVDWASGSGTLTMGNAVDLVAPVPLPATVWLFGSGLIGLARFGREVVPRFQTSQIYCPKTP
jgi:hypothetical protein